jgi:hypothetical protein
MSAQQVMRCLNTQVSPRECEGHRGDGGNDKGTGHHVDDVEQVSAEAAVESGLCHIERRGPS